MSNKLSLRKEGITNFFVTHYLSLCLILTLVLLTLNGVGSILFTTVIGLMLCMVGLLVIEKPIQVDLWILVPFILYNVVSAASSLRTYGNPAEGFASTHTIWVVLYILLCCLPDKERQFLRKLCVLWAGIVASCGILEFIYKAYQGDVRRLSGLLGNPNAQGIFLVMGWFALQTYLSKEESPSKWFLRMEPIIYVALALTMSMGSFLSLGIGILALALLDKPSGRINRLTAILAKAAVGAGTGIVLYLGARYSGQLWICFVIFGYGLLLVFWWDDLDNFVRTNSKMSLAITALGCLVAAAAVWIRPSSIATFSERLAMMKNAVSYLGKDPLLGVGPYQWRMLNLFGSDPYFNTYHIHNALLHIGVELGLIAMLMMVIVVIRYLCKNSDPVSKAGFIAYLAHCMIDTGFFYLCITSFVMMTGVGKNNTKLKLFYIRCILTMIMMWWIWVLAYILRQ